MQHVTVRHFEDRHLVPRHFRKLFCSHLPRQCLHILAGPVNSISSDMVSYFLFGVFQHHVISSSYTTVIHDSEMLVFNQQVIATVLQRRGIGVLFIHSVPVVILFRKSEQPVVVPFVFQCVKSVGIVRHLQIGYRSIIYLFLRGFRPFLIFGLFPFYIPGYLVYFLRDHG